MKLNGKCSANHTAHIKLQEEVKEGLEIRRQKKTKSSFSRVDNWGEAEMLVVEALQEEEDELVGETVQESELVVAGKFFQEEEYDRVIVVENTHTIVRKCCERGRI